MPIARATVRLAKISGIPADETNNVWHFLTGNTSPAYEDIAAALIDFYQAIQAYLSPTLAFAADAHQVDVATVTPGAPGAADDIVSSPLVEEPFTLATVGSLTTALPDEVAVTLSFRGDLAGLNEEVGATRPRARRRGRIYLGPLGANTVDNTTVPAAVTVLGTFRDLVLDSVEAMATALVAQTIEWSVYSRQNAARSAVEHAWIDNAFDTVRSRGIKATERQERAIPTV